MSTSFQRLSRVARSARTAIVGALLVPTLAFAASAQTAVGPAPELLATPPIALSDLAIVPPWLTGTSAAAPAPARVLRSSPRPSYPSDLSGEAGSTVAQFVVDASGHIELGSISIVQSTGPAFTTAVLDVLPRIRFTPARDNGQFVDQTVRMPFVFRGATLAGSL